MLIHRCLLMYIVAQGSILWSQCYDLSSTHLYQPDGRFREQWDKPSYDPKDPSDRNGNLHMDKKEYGKDVHAFALFMGTVIKTPDGWVPFVKHRTPVVYCD